MVFPDGVVPDRCHCNGAEDTEFGIDGGEHNGIGLVEIYGIFVIILVNVTAPFALSYSAE